ncbi:MAG: leucyl/phenylalanyl-tRNA--protein transferase [Bacteroidales bacterium]|nr:leucyl/phenylalanyl-tRNA--protein transferase [Bacteroidales bacterium]
MPVFELNQNIIFPKPELARQDGLLAVGGDLSPQRLLLAYTNGIFPWYSEGEPILWWSPDPRMVLFPNEFKRHKSLKKDVLSGRFEVTIDEDFHAVISACGRVSREGQDGTWITDEVRDAYIRLYEMGVAHSVEVREHGNLVGGLYGLKIGKVFFGESMFHLVTNASKVGLWHCVDWLIEEGVELIDVQQETSHLASQGARLISRESFLYLLVKLIT